MNLPWSSVRLLLAGQEPEDADGVPQGIVGRLYVTQGSALGVKQQAFAAFEPRRVSLLGLGLQQVANQRGPDALIGVIPGESPHSVRMRELAQSCYDTKECLVTSSGRGDVVLVPRSPGCMLEDGFAFLVFTTNLKAADVCDIVRHQSKALVVLDLDNTLVDAAAVAVTQKDWDSLHWQPCSVTTESGRELPAQYAMLMEHDPLADALYIMHWRLGKLCCTFKVRVRRGWERLRDFLVRERSKYEVFVCSKGKQEYVQLLWHMLDPYCQLFDKTDWDWRLNSTFPDAVPRAVQKTLLAALGCVHPLDDAPHTQLACPVMCLDDCPNAYWEEYHHNVMFVEEYRPSDLFTADTGSVLRQVEQRLGEYWAANYAQPAACEAEEGGSPAATSGAAAAAVGEDGGVSSEGPWTRVVDAVVELMHDLLGQPLQFPEGLAEQQERCAALGAWLRDRCSVRTVFGEPAYIGDAAEALASPTAPTSPLEVDKGMPSSAAEAASLPLVEAEHAGDAAAAAEGPDSPCAAPLLIPDALLPAVAVNGKRQYAVAEALLCALCRPSGTCLPGCPACAELAVAAAKAMRGSDAGTPDQAAEFLQLPGTGESYEEDFISSDGWISSACSTPRSERRGGSGGDGDDGWGPREGLPGADGRPAGDSEEDEEEREAASIDAFTSVDPSLQGMGREIFHMKLARISGHRMVMVPNARSISGCLESGSLSLSSSPTTKFGGTSPVARFGTPLSGRPGGLAHSPTMGGRFPVPAVAPKLSSSPPK